MADADSATMCYMLTSIQQQLDISTLASQPITDPLHIIDNIEDLATRRRPQTHNLCITSAQCKRVSAFTTTVHFCIFWLHATITGCYYRECQSADLCRTINEHHTYSSTTIYPSTQSGQFSHSCARVSVPCKAISQWVMPLSSAAMKQKKELTGHAAIKATASRRRWSRPSRRWSTAFHMHDNDLEPDNVPMADMLTIPAIVVKPWWHHWRKMVVVFVLRVTILLG